MTGGNGSDPGSDDRGSDDRGSVGPGSVGRGSGDPGSDDQGGGDPGSGDQGGRAGADRPTVEQVASAAARSALAVPGVVRLQPGLKHAVGRAARALFASGNQEGRLDAAASGVEVARGDSDRGAGTVVTLRVITGVDPSPRAIAGAVQQSVRDRLHRLTGGAVDVIVVIVDVEDDADRAVPTQK